MQPYLIKELNNVNVQHLSASAYNSYLTTGPVAQKLNTIH